MQNNLKDVSRVGDSCNCEEFLEIFENRHLEMHCKGEISSFRERKKDLRIHWWISLFLSTMVFFAKENIVSETKFTGKADGVTLQQKCNLRVAFPIIKINVIYMVRTESAHRRDNLKSICTKNCLKKHPR